MTLPGSRKGRKGALASLLSSKQTLIGDVLGREQADELILFSLTDAGPKACLTRIEAIRAQQLNRRPMAEDVDQLEETGLSTGLIRNARRRLQEDLISSSDLLLMHKARAEPAVIHRLEQLRCRQTGLVDPYRS